MTTTPINTNGFCVEHYSREAGWKPCTEPVPTRKQAQDQRARLGTEDHQIYRVYWAFVRDAA